MFHIQQFLQKVFFYMIIFYSSFPSLQKPNFNTNKKKQTLNFEKHISKSTIIKERPEQKRHHKNTISLKGELLFYKFC